MAKFFLVVAALAFVASLALGIIQGRVSYLIYAGAIVLAVVVTGLLKR
ncbi:hypothetical protein [Lysobacter sp. P5_B9]